jgi:2,3-bisphosphoglycerate-independent phosphoglycerate mutase
MKFEYIQPLLKENKTKIILLVIDGLGGTPLERAGLTELETAVTPNLDELAASGLCGLHQPVAPGITPGSGPSHLALFGYDPLQYKVGRGVLAALGIDFDLSSRDVAARGNFCTINEQGKVTDRRAGRISTEKNKELCKLLQKITLPDTELFVKTVKEHRFLLVLRGEGLSGDIYDTDPQDVGVEPLEPKPNSPAGTKSAALVSTFAEQARQVLQDHLPANMVLLRGFSQRPQWPLFDEVFGTKAGAIAAYPMYLGLAKLIGMKPFHSNNNIEDELDVLQNQWGSFDFFYVHIKSTDSAGEDGDFDRKVRLIEEVDQNIPRIRSMEPNVIIVTGDHSTPSLLKSHSWHPVPTILWAKHCRPDKVIHFGERDCLSGGLGVNFPAVDLMPLALANAFRLDKYGA